MRKSTRCLFGAFTAALAVAASGNAQAQSDDPQVDPNSPAGTEYQLPLDRAREEAGGGRGGGGTRGSGGSRQAALFGEGVEPRRPVGTGASSSGTGAGSSTQTAGASEAQEQDSAGSAPATVRAQAPAPDGGGSGLLAVGAGAVGVLVLGGRAGVLWRRHAVSAG
jgi:hypothetical protein